MRSGLPWVLGVCVFTASPIFAQTTPSPGIPEAPATSSNVTPLGSTSRANGEKIPEAPATSSNVTPLGSTSRANGEKIPEAPATSSYVTGPILGAQNLSPAGPPSSEVVVISDEVVQQDPYKFWVRLEYLGWWVKNTPLPISLVTGDPSNPTHELLDSSRNLGTFSGMRLGMGVWFDPFSNIGMELSAFGFARQTRTFFASSDSGGNPELAFRFNNQTPGQVGDYLMPITSPGVFAGHVQVTSSLQLWGVEANGVFALLREAGFEWIAVAGFRYANLSEKLNISTLSADILTDPATVLFQSDQFNTHNQFYGAQIGSRINWQAERMGFDLTGKLAMGVNHQAVDIQGYSTQTGPGGVNGTFPGGFFSQPSNIGHFTANRFSVIPSIEAKLHYLVTPRLRAFVGYDFMYWTQVIRPGDQVDRNINLSQSAIFGSGVLSGPATPAPLLSRSDFWAQGVTFGLEFRF